MAYRKSNLCIGESTPFFLSPPLFAKSLAMPHAPKKFGYTHFAFACSTACTW